MSKHPKKNRKLKKLLSKRRLNHENELLRLRMLTVKKVKKLTRESGCYSKTQAALAIRAQRRKDTIKGCPCTL